MASIDTIQNDWITKVFEKASKSAFGNPLITNINRGLIAEAIVDLAIEPSWHWVSSDYSGWDFEHPNGLRLEVKQSALLQSWNDNGSLSKASFDIAPRTGRYEGQTWIDEIGRAAQIYVFAHHTIATENADHRDPKQWEFYVIAASELPNQKTISLNPLKSLCKAVRFEKLFARVSEVAQTIMPPERA